MGRKCPIRALKMHPLVQRLKKELVDEARRRFLRALRRRGAQKLSPPSPASAGGRAGRATFTSETASAVSRLKAAPRAYVRSESF